MLGSLTGYFLKRERDRQGRVAEAERLENERQREAIRVADVRRSADGGLYTAASKAEGKAEDARS